MKKTNKENPITTFRKANEARQKVVKASLKKAQDGIEMNDAMINNATSTKYKTGGTTKATKFAALAPPYNKATAADRIVGAKKNAKKK